MSKRSGCTHKARRAPTPDCAMRGVRRTTRCQGRGAADRARGASRAPLRATSGGGGAGAHVAVRAARVVPPSPAPAGHGHHPDEVHVHPAAPASSSRWTALRPRTQPFARTSPKPSPAREGASQPRREGEPASKLSSARALAALGTTWTFLADHAMGARPRGVGIARNWHPPWRALGSPADRQSHGLEGRTLVRTMHHSLCEGTLATGCSCRRRCTGGCPLVNVAAAEGRSLSATPRRQARLACSGLPRRDLRAGARSTDDAFSISTSHRPATRKSSPRRRRPWRRARTKARHGRRCGRTKVRGRLSARYENTGREQDGNSVARLIAGSAAGRSCSGRASPAARGEEWRAEVDGVVVISFTVHPTREFLFSLSRSVDRI
jgi:hypothetical protein